MNKNVSVAVLGSTGYVGLELIKILINHPFVNINFLGSENYVGKNIYDLDKHFLNNQLPKLESNKDLNAEDFDFVFLALPHGTSNKFVKKLYNKVKIIDLSADFRLNFADVYKENYNNEHECLNLLGEFTYGLCEINKDKIINSKYIAVPGCYPTSVLLPLIPILKNNLIVEDSIIIDSKSGYSGAGKKFELLNIKNNEDFNFYNYNTNNHRHICEINQELNKHSKKEISVSFNPHILPVFRGMMSTIYCDLKKNFKSKDLTDTLYNFSKDLDFVNFIDSDEKIDFFSIQKKNNCLIKLEKTNKEDKIIIVSIIDNLFKGASGQAVQCMNLMCGFDEITALTNK